MNIMLTEKKTHLHSLITMCVLLLLLLVAQLMSGGLSLSSFKKLHTDSLIASHDAVGAEIAGKINRSLRLGKPLGNFIGMDKLLQQGQRDGSNISDLAVVDSNGTLLYSIKQLAVPTPNHIEQATAVNLDTPALVRNNYFLHGQDLNYLLFPLVNRAASVQGYLCLSFANDQMDDKQGQILYASLQTLGWTTLLAALLLTGGFYFIFNRKSLQRRWIIYLFLFVVLGGAQLGYSVFNITLFQKHYLEITQTKATNMAALLKRDVNFLLERGLSFDALYNIDKRMEQTVERVPEIAAIDIVDGRGVSMYHAGSDAAAAAELTSYLPLTQRGTVVGQVKVMLAAEVLAATTKEIALNSLTVVALSFLFIMELMVFLFATLLAPLLQDSSAEISCVSQDALIRPTTFVYIFAAALCYSFIPLYMGQLYRPISGFSRELILGLPLTVEMLGGGLVLVPVGRWIDRKGWHQAFLYGSVVSIAGAVMSGFAGDQFTFIAARTLMGVGYAMVWMSAQGFVLLNANPGQRASGISNVVAGIFSGIICGNAVGAMVAQQLGFRPVFILAAGLIVLSLLFALIFMRHSFHPPASAPPESMLQQPIGLRHLVTDPQALLLFICSLFPYSVVMVGLLYYVTPLYLKQIGTSQSTIGRVIMLFGLCMIFVAPKVSKFADRLSDKRVLVFGGGVLGGFSMLVFLLTKSFWVVPIAVVLLGLSVSVSGAARNLLTIGLPITHQLGTTRVMGAYRSIDKIGQALGPLLLALLLGWLPLASAMATLGGVYLFLTIMLMVGLKRQSS